jgi:hypothetical protein
MIVPTETQVDAATRLNVSLHLSNVPLAVARLCEIVADLTKRVEELEQQKRSWPRK